MRKTPANMHEFMKIVKELVKYEEREYKVNKKDFDEDFKETKNEGMSKLNKQKFKNEKRDFKNQKMQIQGMRNLYKLLQEEIAENEWDTKQLKSVVDTKTAIKTIGVGHTNDVNKNDGEIIGIARRRADGTIVIS